MTENDFQIILMNEIRLLLKPLIDATQYNLSRKILFANLGWDIDNIPGLNKEKLISLFNEISGGYENIVKLVEDPPRSLSQIIQALQVINNIFKIVSELGKLIDEAAVQPPPQFNHMGKDVIALLTTSYLRAEHPIIYRVGVLLGFIRSLEEPPLGDPITGINADAIIRYPHLIPEFRFRNIDNFLKDPITYLKTEYLFGQDLDSVEQARKAADKLFVRMGALLAELGLNAIYGIKPEYMLNFGDLGNKLGSRMLTVYDSSSTSKTFGVTLTVSSINRGNIGLVVVPFGEFKFTKIAGSWEFAFDLAIAMEGFALGPNGLTLPRSAPDNSNVRGRVTVTKIPETENQANPALVIGSSTGTRLEIGQLQIIAELDLSTNSQDIRLLLNLGSASLIIKPEDGDGFLQQVIPSDGLRINFVLAIGWSKARGFYIEGSSNLEARLPVHKFLGPVSIEWVNLAIEANGQEFRSSTSITAKIRLGPLDVIMERVGLQLSMSFPEEGGNLGLANLDLILKPPEGLGISLDTSGVKGGGYIWRSQDQYAGVIDLDLRGFRVQALAVLDTKPDISLFFAIFATFQPPFQIGGGWKITRIGGFIGFNRTISLQEIASGIKSGSLDNILFPDNVIQNAPRIIGDFKRIFPSKSGQNLIGPAIRIEFGTPTIVRGDIAVILEFPAPFQLSVLGKLTARIPENSPIIELNLGLIGAIDFVKGWVGIYGSLYNSRILEFTLSGDMAMVASWGAEKNFMFSIGGFNPRYNPPPEFPPFGAPPLSRLRLALASTFNFECYLALTSNTFQIGALVDARISIGDFTIAGSLGFDALIQFSPLYYIVDVAASFSVKYRGATLAALLFRGSLEGPNPHRIKGKVTISILFINIDVGVDVTFGSPRGEAITKIDPWDMLKPALEKEESWTIDIPESESTDFGVIIRGEILKDTRILHPLGTLKVTQKVLPFNHLLTKFGATYPTNNFRFEIVKVTAGPPSISTSSSQELKFSADVLDYFAPAQFSDYDNDKKLSIKSYVAMLAGAKIKLGGNGSSYGQAAFDANSIAQRDNVYEVYLKTKEPPKQKDKKPPQHREDSLHAQVLGLSSASYNALTKNNKILRNNFKHRSQKVSITEEQFIIVDQNLAPTNIEGLKDTFSQATAINKLEQLNPKERQNLRVISSYEKEVTLTQ